MTEPAGPVGEPPPDPFLRTRIVPPARPAAYLPRPRLVRHLDRALRTPLTLVDGPAGAGKTLLTADWVAGLREPVAWLTVEEGDERPGVFWAYLLGALRGCGALGPGPLPADASQVDGRLLAALAAELDASGRHVVVVLDEFDRVDAPEVAEQLEFVLHHAGPCLHLVLVTRTEPLLPLHRYRAAGGLTEIRAADLAFTPEETVSLLELHGLNLSVPTARALVDRTRGWAAGLGLSALAARESPDPEGYLKEFEAGHSAIADFLLAEVLEGRTARTQDLLLRVSVLERFCPDLANELTGRVDAEPLLVDLHRANAFVEDLGQSWYRLHPLFGEILRAHLRVRLPGLEPELHRRAARWLHRSGFLPEALAHGAAAGEWDFAAGALVGDLAIGGLFTGLRAGDLTELFSGMGPEARTPATELVRAARDLARCDPERAVARLRRAEAGLPTGRFPEECLADGLPDPAAVRLSRTLLEALAARLSGSPTRADEAARAADELRREVPERLLEEHPELTALLLTHVGSARLWAGRFEDARAALTAVVRVPAGPSTVLPRQDALGHLALLDHLTGWTGRAERRALAALAEEERAGLAEPSGSGLARLVLAAVAVDRHEPDRAGELLGTGDPASGHLAPGGRDPVPAAGRALVTARLLLAEGRAQAAAEAVALPVAAVEDSPWASGHAAVVTAAAHLAEGRPDAAAALLDGVSGDQPACAVEAAALQLAAGRAGAAAGLLDGLRAHGGTGPAVAVRAALVRARAADAAGDAATARKLVERALLDARRERLRRPFLDAGAWIRPVLASGGTRELAAGWLTPGSSARGGERPSSPPPPDLVAAELSGRERDVLVRLAGMMSAEEIAADLHVSVNTVKSHLKSVYRKLAVNRRGDAVRRARELELL
ncbi:LuxR C-terminal-related transcriptional regulator [Streptomyces fragilis]|uniref:LuxR C-terminal-related transcriptional regulator n=1 Tax=Streptomyces fragilis TaxID=67301 RepID=A0ABV2YEQ1_9ACTN|nr:LuxR C-terminal-related transcriptional regulator [Streptomyces fragilis]